MTETSSEDFTDTFWQLIEMSMGCVVPRYLQYVLKIRGYDSAASIGTLTMSEIQQLQEFMKSKLKNCPPQDTDRKNYYHSYHNDSDEFEILPGHVKLLEKVVYYINSMTESHGPTFFYPRFEKNSRKPENPKGVAIRKNVDRGFKTIPQTSVLEIQNGTARSSTVSFTSSLSSCPDYNKIETTGVLNDSFENSVVKEQMRLFENIRLWMKNHAQQVNEKFTERINSNMVEVNITIRCPICEEHIELNKIFSKTREQVSKSISYSYSLAEFEQHMEHHTAISSKSRSPQGSSSIPIGNSYELKKCVRDRVPQEDLGDTQDSTECNGTFLLNVLVASAEKNMLRSKPGYRFDLLIKMFACFIKMTAGLLAYETLHANLPLSLPSTSTVDKFMKDNGPAIIEGKLRTEELFQYLKDRNLPLRVAVSEDATRITPKVSYDPKTNQLVGFALPMDEHGMPIPFSFNATSAKEIQKHFLDPKNYVSSSVIVQMAQPQSETVPPFCLSLFLTDNRFTSEKILIRWNFTTHELQLKGLKVDNYSTDGDPRSLKVMKLKSQLGVTDLTFLNCKWYSCGNAYNITFTQDMTHIGTKARNRALKVSRITPIGSKLISITHLNYLMEHVSKDKHLLTPHDVQPKDRQNFNSVEKICAPKVLSCLEEYVPESEGTAMFLKAVNFTIYSYLDIKMSPADRVYKIWYAIFFFRVWRSWLMKSKYSLKESFISSNCYTCIELNGHTMVKQLLKTQTDPNYVFNPKQQGSQQCESKFRQVRSMSSTFSTVVNCSMIDIINRMHKLQLQSDIMNDCFGKIKFPRLEKKEKNASALTLIEMFAPPSKDEIISWIEKAKADLSRDMMALGINSSKLKLDFKCQVKSTNFEKEFVYEDFDDEASDEDESDDDESRTSDSDDSSNNEDPVQDIELEEDLRKLSGITGELSMQDYSRTAIKLDTKSPFAVVMDSMGKESVVRKSSICWLLSKNKIKLSSDRLQRVMEKDFQPHSGKAETTNGFVKNEEIHVGDWCVFQQNNNLVIGLVLSFCYTDGNTFKARAFTKSNAEVLSEKAIGVLATWYSWNKEGVLELKSIKRHEFVPIERYKGTVHQPTYSNKKIFLPKNVLDQINIEIHA